MRLLGLIAVVVAFAAFAAEDKPALRHLDAVQLKKVDAGTLPTPCLGCLVFDVVGPRLLISDGGTWAPACQ